MTDTTPLKDEGFVKPLSYACNQDSSKASET